MRCLEGMPQTSAVSYVVVRFVDYSPFLYNTLFSSMLTGYCLFSQFWLSRHPEVQAPSGRPVLEQARGYAFPVVRGVRRLLWRRLDAPPDFGFNTTEKNMDRS